MQSSHQQAWDTKTREDKFLADAEKNGVQFTPETFKASSSKHLNKVLDYDPYDLVSNGECPHNWEILGVKNWLNAWIQLFKNTQLLE